MWKELFKDVSFYRRIAVTLVLGVAFYLFSAGAINGVPHVLPGQGRTSEEPAGWKRWVPAAVALIPIFEISPFANLKGAEISGKPADWTEEKGIRLVTGAELEGRSLRYARAESAFLVNANIEGADLRGADFYGADFRGARLNGANLGHAFLPLAKLWRAEMRGANLEKAVLLVANLKYGRPRKG